MQFPHNVSKIEQTFNELNALEDDYGKKSDNVLNLILGASVDELSTNS